MKNLFKMQALLAIFLVGGLRDLCAEVYSATKTMPELTTSELLSSMSTKLYELYRASDADRGGMEGLVDPKLWEPWIKGGLYFTTTQKAITYKALVLMRDKVLAQVSIIAKIFADTTKAKRGTQKDYKKVSDAASAIFSLLNSTLKPCDVPDSAGDCEKPQFQEQWSLLKVLGLVFPHCVRMLKTLFEESAGSAQSFIELKNAIEKQTTLLFLGDLDLRSNFSPEDRENYPFIFKNLDKIDKNVFLAVPLRAPKDEKSFIDYLNRVLKFIGESDKQRAKDAQLIEKYWKATMDSLEKAFKALHKLQKKDVSGERIKADKINIKLLPWDKRFADSVKPYFTWLPVANTEINAIIARCNKGKLACYGEDCRNRYELLFLVSNYLQATLDNIKRSLTNLQTLTSLQMMK